jgi:aspartate oxidase
MSTPMSPVRRVLGDKPTNTSIRKQSPTKHTAHKPHNSGAWRTQSSAGIIRTESTASRSGQKRSIEEVEDAEREDASAQDSQASDATQALSLLSDASQSRHETAGTSMKLDEPVRPFAQSQGECAMIETTFEIPDEPSQNTRDKLVCVRTIVVRLSLTMW